VGRYGGAGEKRKSLNKRLKQGKRARSSGTSAGPIQGRRY
jgi:hypothetical protein